jgi:hypothetical protein
LLHTLRLPGEVEKSLGGVLVDGESVHEPGGYMVGGHPCALSEAAQIAVVDADDLGCLA